MSAWWLGWVPTALQRRCAMMLPHVDAVRPCWLFLAQIQAKSGPKQAELGWIRVGKGEIRVGKGEIGVGRGRSRADRERDTGWIERYDSGVDVNRRKVETDA
eukprot:3913376-Rhodomonas_salina.1